MKDSNKDEGSGNSKAEGKPDSDAARNQCWTRAEPFAIADPTLGKLDADLDPSKVRALCAVSGIRSTTSVQHVEQFFNSVLSLLSSFYRSRC